MEFKQRKKFSWREPGKDESPLICLDCPKSSVLAGLPMAESEIPATKSLAEPPQYLHETTRINAQPNRASLGSYLRRTGPKLAADMRIAKLGGLLLVFTVLAPQARADIAVLLEEPYSYDGAFAGTGHVAVYLKRVCAASPTVLRRCAPGEPGVVISRYNRIAGYDWIAIPLIPYLYAVAKPQDIPLYADAKIAVFLRDQYRRGYLGDLAPDKPSGETPGGDWVQLVGSSYDRTSYGFQIETTAEQDDEFIRWLNSRPNITSYKVMSRNCADFVRDVVNFYYPKAVSRGLFSDFDVATPKHTAKSLVKYSGRHRDLEFSSFVIPQVPGSIKRSRPVRGMAESVFKAKKYVLPLALFHPFLAGGVASAYMAGGRFNPAKNALVFSPNGGLESPLTEVERRTYQNSLDDLSRAIPIGEPADERATWQQFQEKAKPGLDHAGRPILQASFADKMVALGISRESFADGEPPPELKREFLIMRLREELAGGRAPRTSSLMLRDDWQLLQGVISAEWEGVSARANLENRESESTSRELGAPPFNLCCRTD
jgi:hypothetical protein